MTLRKLYGKLFVTSKTILPRKGSVTMGKEKPAEGKFVASVKVGPKGQIIVPKEVRDMFHIQPGDMLLMLADMEQGIAIQTFDTTDEMFEKHLPAKK